MTTLLSSPGPLPLTDPDPDPFRTHLVALLSIYELGPPGAPLPRYDGPSDWQTDTILRSLNAIAKRIHSTEESDDNTSQVTIPQQPSQQRKDTTPMTISLDGLQSSIDPSKLFSRAYGNMKAQAAAANSLSNGVSSAPPSSHGHTAQCPTCGKPASVLPLPALSSYTNTADSSPLSDASPLVVPMGPLAAAAFESGMSAVEELKLLKAQVQDVARVCNAVARGDLSQKITVPVQGVVMVQLKDVINTMVGLIVGYPYPLSYQSRSTNSDNSQRKSHVFRRKSARKGWSCLASTASFFLILGHP